MSDEKSENKGHKHKKTLFRMYIARILIFLAIAFAFTILTIILSKNLITNYIHKAESAYGITVDDLSIDDSFYPNSLDGIPAINSYKLGRRVASIKCDVVGLNSNVYFGADRLSMRYGCGLSTEYTLFGEKGVSFVTGYEEAELNVLNYISVGDNITVETEYGTVTYTVDDYFIGNTGDLDFDIYTQDTLIISSIYPMLSDDWGKSLIVIAYADGEVH